VLGVIEVAEAEEADLGWELKEVAFADGDAAAFAVTLVGVSEGRLGVALGVEGVFTEEEEEIGAGGDSLDGVVSVTLDVCLDGSES